MHAHIGITFGEGGTRNTGCFLGHAVRTNLTFRHHLPEIDQGEPKMMESETIGCFALKADQQGLEFVNPGERSFTHEAMGIHCAVKMPLTAPLHRLAVPFIFSTIGNQGLIPEQLPGSTGIKAAIGVEEGTFIVQLVPFHIGNQVLEFLFQRITIIMVAGNDSRRANDISIADRYGQDIAGFGLFSPLIGDCFAPFFAALWLPSRLSSDTFNSPVIVMILASKSRWRLPSLLHLRKG
jgi:hypothetical protein